VRADLPLFEVLRRIGNAAASYSRRPKLRLTAGVLVPVATYLILSQALNSDLAALAIAEAIPVGWMLAIGLPRRRVHPLAVVWALVLAVAVVVSIASGGSVLPLKLRRAVITGSLGLAFLGSVLVRRPLLPVAMDGLARAWPRTERLARLLGGQTAPRRAIVLTAIVGVTLLADATAQVTLALTVSTAVFLAASRLARVAVFAVGLGGCAFYLRWPGSRESGRAASRGPEGTPRLTSSDPRGDLNVEASLGARTRPS
jgi:hypothetical protein